MQAGGPGPRALLNHAWDSLRPGGLVVGHLEQMKSVHGLRDLLMQPSTWHTAMQRWPVASAPRCLHALKRAGFDEVECYFVEPRISAPTVLVPSRAAAARWHFVRAVRRNRALYGLPGYAARLALAGFGLGGLLQPHLFFTARKPC